MDSLSPEMETDLEKGGGVKNVNLRADWKLEAKMIKYTSFT